MKKTTIFFLMLFTVFNVKAQSNQISLWKFEDNLNDEVGNYSISLSGTEYYETGQVGKAIQLDGTGQYLYTDTIVDLGDEFSVSGYYKIWAYSGVRTLFSNSSGSTPNGIIGTVNCSTGVLSLITGNGSSTLTATSTTGNHSSGVWIKFQFDVNKTSGECDILVDDTDVSSSTSIRNDFNSNAVFYMGAESDGSDLIWGRLDEISIATDSVSNLPTVNVTATDASASESGPDQGTFTITRSDSDGNLTVNYTLSGTAVSSDYSQSLTGSVTISDGNTSFNINITPVDDATCEGNETLIMTLSSDTAYTIGTNSNATINIADDDCESEPCSVIANWKFEDDLNDEIGTYSISLSGTEYYETGQVGHAIQLDGQGYYLYTNSSVDLGDEFSISGYYKIWGTSGTRTLFSNSSGSTPNGIIATVNCSTGVLSLTTGNGSSTLTATSSSGNHTSGAWIKFQFDVNKTTGQCDILVGDTDVSSLTSIRTDFNSNAVFYMGAESDGTDMIWGRLDEMEIETCNGPYQTSVNIVATDASASESGPNQGTFTITRSDSDGNITVYYTVGGTTDTADYSPSLMGSVTITDGNTSIGININPVDDANCEGSETLIMTLSSDTAYTIGSNASATIIIADDDCTSESYNVYYGHIHNHSELSDGTGSPSYNYAYAKSVGMDFYSLADHDYALTSTEYEQMQTVAESYNEDGVFTTFWGFEWSSTYGHVTVLNTDDFCMAGSTPTNTFDKLLNWMSSYDCIAFCNHPGRGDSTIEFNKFASTPDDKVVGMELWNKTDGFSTYYYNDGYYSNDGGRGYWDEGLVRGWKLGAGGSDDNHAGNPGGRSQFRMAILADSLTRNDLYQAMKARRFYSTLDSNLVLSFQIDGNEMGSTLFTGSSVQIVASDGDNESFTNVKLFKNGLQEESWTINTTSVNISYSISPSMGDSYYVKVTQSDGDEAISSPIWIDNTSPTCAITSPANNSNYETPQTITISVDASDTDGSVDTVKFFVNDVYLASDPSSPYSTSYTIPSTGLYTLTAQAKDNYGATTMSTPVYITVGVQSDSTSARISSDINDVEEYSNGSVYTGSTDIELVDDGGTNQTIGLRFTGLAIPQGATITSANILFTCDETDSGTCNLEIKGHDHDNSPAFTTTTYDVSSRTTTTASVSWSPAPWTTVGEADSSQTTSDISSVIQEIVNRVGFSESSAITIIITGSGERTAESYGGSPSDAALLSVSYIDEEKSQIIPRQDRLEEPENYNLDFILYPVPASSGKVKLKIDHVSSSLQLSIIDINRKTLIKRAIEEPVTELNLSNISPGVYIVKVMGDNGIMTKKLIIK